MEYTLLGNHPSIQKIRELIDMVSDTAFNVLLLGESGTGKEVIARLLHAHSTRRNKKFVKVNCAALPHTLLESELFGFEKGAFTGADKPKPGKFELASDGVMFLDEIGDMPLTLQAKLLHVIQSGEFNRLGGTRDIKVKAGIISSTNHDLEREIGIGPFQRLLAALAPRLGEGSGHGKVLLLHHLQVFHEPGVVFGPQVAVHLPGRARQGVKGVIAHAAVDAGPQHLGRKGARLGLLDEIVHAGAHAGVAIDDLVDQR